ncbi:glutamic acid-rich protein-like [Asterias rubens]|uniref:glutamic acid-rich protein-like n=1 Tax=Asterias rubens TaxID=7604 RepID=UPI001455BC0A|nr:glutamic acid-rich protein-like [Asterias rubens]
MVQGKKKGKGKVKVPRPSLAALNEKAFREEEQHMRNAIRESTRQAGLSMSRGFRALVETSESKEEEFIDRAMAQAREMFPWCEEEDSVASEDMEEDGGSEDVEDDEANETEHQESEEEEVRDDGSEDEGGAGPSKQQGKSCKKRPRKKRVTEPDSDNDPDPPSAYQGDHAPDEEGWTRVLEHISIRDFKGKQPAGPTFRKKKLPINYFLKFFPVSL